MQYTVLDYLESACERFPDKVAIKDNKSEYTYYEYCNTARIIGSNLAKRTKTGEPVVIYMQKKPDDPVSFMGALYAGCFYTPIDNQMPLDRVKLILNTVGPAAVIYDATTEDNIRELGLEDISVSFDDISRGEPDEELLREIRSNICQTDTMYALFTSGSTGVPKGVMISHLAAVDCIEWAVSVFNLDDSIRICNQAPFYFDLSVLDIYVAVKTGGTLYVPPKTYYTFPSKVLKYMDDNQINFINWAPSAYCNVVNTGAFETCVPRFLKHAWFIGEVMPCKHLNVWRKYLPDVQYVNTYGPTEATYACMYYIIDREFPDDGNIPLGRACENSRILLLDEEGKPVKDGEMGEICVTGQCLSGGYCRNPGQTAKAFVTNPLNDRWAERMYKTGDLAYIDEAGDMIFAGRNDSQIKRLGYRIELGEIERVILAVPGIENACCMYDQVKSDIIAVYTGNSSEDDLLDILTDKIPNYMLPGQLIKLEEMPLNLNGKIDRPLLKKTYITQ